MSKFAIRMLPLLGVLLLAGVNSAHAQSVSAYFGLGSAFDSAPTNPGCASGQIFDPLSSSTTPGCVPASDMGGVFGVFGADFMITPHLGFNGEYSFRFAQSHYVTSLDNGTGGPIPINIRPAFYDFNAVYQPGSGDKKIVPVLEGGIGGAKMSFYLSQSLGTISTQNQLFATSNHFQVHGAVGVKLYVKSDIFIKPQVDIHYVPNLTNQYGRNVVPEFTIAIGYSFGRT